MCQLSDRFYSAVQTLASDGPIKKRLIMAYNDNLVWLKDAELPAEIRPGFDKLWRTMHAVQPLGIENPVIATVRKMSAHEASRCAGQICAMFGELVRVKTTGERLETSKNKSRTTNLAMPSTLN